MDIIVDLAYYYMMYSQIPSEYLYKAGTEVSGLLGAGWDRTDMIMVGQLTAKVDITRFLALELSYRLEITNDLFNEDAKFGVQVGNAVDYFAYTRHLVMGTVVLRY